MPMALIHYIGWKSRTPYMGAEIKTNRAVERSTTWFIANSVDLSQIAPRVIERVLVIRDLARYTHRLDASN